jgi:hypothetical protein
LLAVPVVRSREDLWAAGVGSSGRRVGVSADYARAVLIEADCRGHDFTVGRGDGEIEVGGTVL